MRRAFRFSGRRDDPRRDVDDEIRLHLELRTQEFVTQGMDPAAARRAAEASFGDVTAVATECTDIDQRHRRARGWHESMREIAGDARLALRSFARNLGFTLSTVLTLALGIGSGVTVFTIVNGVLFRPLPYASPDRLVMLWLEGAPGSGPEGHWPLSAPIYLDAHDHARSLQGLAAFRATPSTLGEGSHAQPVAHVRTRPELFATLGVHPRLGRTFTEAESVPAGPPLAVISDGLWRRYLDATPDAVGRTITLSGTRYTVIGVMPPGFAFPRGTELPPGLAFPARTDVWTPLAFSERDLNQLGVLNLAAVGRMPPGVTFADVHQELPQIMAHVEAAHSRALTGPAATLHFEAVTIGEQAAESVRRSLLILAGAVGFLLVITAVNVTNLLIGRTVARQREFALRAAIGARSRRIAAQLVTEHLVLAFLGTLVGTAIATWATRGLLTLIPDSLPRADDVALDWRVLLAAGSLAAVMGIAFGVITAWHAGRVEPAAALQGPSGRTTTGVAGRRGRRVLVMAEVALSLVLLIAAGLLAGSLSHLLQVDPGFAPDHVITAEVALPTGDDFAPLRDGARWSAFFDQLIPRLTAVPGVRAVGAASALPLGGEIESSSFTVAGDPTPPNGQRPRTQYAVVSGNYFGALRIRITRGRAFDDHDRAASLPVVIVSRELVRRYLSGRDPIGVRIESGWDFQPTVREIVGVVDDVRETTLNEDVVPIAYVPESQMSYPGLTLAVRTTADPTAVLPAIRDQVAALQPSVALDNVRTLNAVVATSLERQRFSLVVVGAFAASALALALIGLYGVIALSVRQRGPELGLRLALGAQPRDVRRLVLLDGMQLTGVGIAIGLAGALVFTRFMQSLLYGLSPTDPRMFAAAATLVATVAMGALLFPALRATSIDPASSLRVEG